jgi:NAD(P)-dependent dehydrogenase (short-subunit alcohol dehydrogenase family)
MHINNLLSLKNCSAIVIGGSGKIGFPISEALAEAGAKVYICSTNPENFSKSVKKLREKNLDVEGFKLDQTSEDDINSLINLIRKSKFPLKVLVNSGVIRPMKLFFEDTLLNWNKSMAINAGGLFMTCKLFGQELVKNEGGSIINVSSIYGTIAPDMSIYDGSDFETEPDYPYTKGGMNMFSKYLASYYANKNVRVNIISPGGFFNDQKQPFLDNYTKKVPMKRMAFHNDLKGVAVFLASNASSYITGNNIFVDGGFNII